MPRKKLSDDKNTVAYPEVTIHITDETDSTRTSLGKANVPPEPSEGNFLHYRKKVRQIYLNELAQPPEPFLRFKEKKAEHFASVVDLDAYEYHKVVFHTFLNEILQSTYFRGLILFLVMLNAVMIGIQTFPTVTDSPIVSRSFAIVDQIILSIFIFEIILKWLYEFRLFWKVMWNVLDITIIFLVLSSAVLPVSSGNGRALVTVRVIRAFRSLRSVSSMASLSIVSHMVVKSGRDMLNIILVLIIFMLVMSVMGVILFDVEEISLKEFVNGLDSWYCVFICVTQDGWADLLDDFQNVGAPDFKHNYDKLLVIYLCVAVAAGGFVFANLIVAVIVTNLELAVAEFRGEKAMSENPLDFIVKNLSHLKFTLLMSDQLSSEVDVLSVHDLLVKNNTALIAQRPFKIPSLKKVSLRRLQAYTGLIVAQVHNVLEAEIIHMDLEKVMAVVVSTMAQLDIYKSKNQLEFEKNEAIQELNKYATFVSMIPTDKVTQIDALEKLKNLKHHRASDPHKDSIITRDSY